MFEHAVIQYEISQIYLFTIVNISILSSGNIHRTFYIRKSRSNYGNTYHLYFSCIWRNHILLDSDICRRRKTRAVSSYNRISHPSCRMPNNDLTSSTFVWVAAKFLEVTQQFYTFFVNVFEKGE